MAAAPEPSRHGHGHGAGSPGPRRLLKDEAYARIRAHLLDGQAADEPCSERGLAARLGLGLGPVRSALERLRAEGLIRVSPNSGIRLPEITAREILDFYELRTVIECHVAASLAGRLSAGQAEQVRAILDEQEGTAARGETGRYHELDLEFHTALAAFHGNGEMERALRQLRDKMYRLARRMHRDHPERLAINVAQHRGIFEAVRAGDAGEAQARMRTHLDWGRRFTLDPDGRLGSGWRHEAGSRGGGA
jgi:DNA-binding GntR family transcriptional regulator